MDIRWIGFGQVEIDGRRYDRDVVIDRGRIRTRDKGPSKRHRDAVGHTPLTAGEAIPWNGDRLIVGTGADGRLPLTADVHEEATRRGVAIVALPTEDACRLLSGVPRDEVRAILHLTC